MLPRETAARAAALALQRADLLSRRGDLLARLSRPDLDPADRQGLQISAARALKELDEVEEALATVAPSEGDGKKQAAPTGGRAFAQAHPLLSGALLGGGMVGMVAALVIWAQSDARPDPEAAQAPTQGSRQGAGGADFRGQAPLEPEAARRAEELRRQIEADPRNLDLHRALAQLLLTNGRAFDAFQQARRMLEIDPEDPDARYVSGVVRYTMGQPDAALAELGRALASDPGHEQAALMRGLVLLQLGDREGAVAIWQAANEARESPRLQQIIAMAREGRAFEEILGAPFRE